MSTVTKETNLSKAEKKLIRERAYRARNKEKIRQIAKRYRLNNLEKCKERDKQYRLKTKHIRNERDRKRYHEDTAYRKKVNKKINARHKRRLKKDVLYAVKSKLRQAVALSFSRAKQGKSVNTEKLLGCTWFEAKAHIESLWKEGMNWNNHGQGRGKWQIDHIRPVSSFTSEEIHLMNHITNLQPLWSDENNSKGNYYPV
jgi:hypothetical protein